MNSPIDQLTTKQLEALKLVADYRSSKEIARELDLSSHAVDERLKRVQAILGVSGRAEAARLYRHSTENTSSATSEEAWGDLTYGSPGLCAEAATGDEEPSPGERNRSGDEPMSLQQPQAAYVGDWVEETPTRSFFSVLFEAGRQNDLSPLARTVCIGGLTSLAIMTMAVAVSLAEGLSRIF